MMEAPYKVQLDPEKARELAQSGAIILLLDVPNGTVIGIDQQVYVVGPNFKGVKMVPPGAHFVSSNAVSSNTSASTGAGSDVAPTASFFVDVALRQVIIRRWDRLEELLLQLDNSDEEARLAHAARSFQFDSSLAPYNLAALQQWRSLSGYISGVLIQKVAPVNSANLSVTTEADPSLEAPKTAAEERLAQQLKSKAHVGSGSGQAAPEAAPGASGADTSGKVGSASRGDKQEAGKISAKGVGRCFYAAVPSKATGADMSPTEVTRVNMDKSALLQSMIDREYGRDPQMLLGELQFALLAFLLGHSLEAFGQWKALLRLLLSCEDAPVHSLSAFYTEALSVVHAQLSHCLANSRDARAKENPLQLGMTSELLADSFLKTLFNRFYHTLQLHSPLLHRGLQVAAKQLQELLERELGWDLSVSDLQGDSDDEDAPVIVQLSASC